VKQINDADDDFNLTLFCSYAAAGDTIN